MGFPKHIYRKANSILADRRQKAEDLGEQQKEEIYAAIPELRQIEQQLAETGRGVIAAVAARSGDVRQIVESLKQRSLTLQERRRRLLEEAGVPEDYLQPPYTCQKCHDQGYVNNHRCSCMEKLLRQLATQELGGAGLENFSFHNFSLEYYSEVPNENGTIPRSYMANLKNYCQDYARCFDPKKSNSLLFVGGTGLGKTHLSLAIAREVIDKGYGVIYASVQNLMARLEEERFNSGYVSTDEEAELRYLSMVMETDLLILDDLGTEYLNQFISSTIYNLVNTRLLRNKATIISTNLLPGEIGKRYSDRLVSRLFGSYKTVNFIGKDIRIQKGLMG